MVFVYLYFLPVKNSEDFRRKQLQPQSGSWERVVTANCGDWVRLPVEAKTIDLDLCG